MNLHDDPVAPPALVPKSRLIPGLPRRRRRHHVALAGQLVRERDFREIGTRILDLSEFGMSVATSSALEIGDSILVAFMAPYSRTWVDAEAMVRRVSHGRRRSDRTLAAGLEFTVIDQVARALLREQLKGLPPPLPTYR